MVIQNQNGSVEIICDWCAGKLSDYITDLPKDTQSAYRVAETLGFKTNNGHERCSYCV
jgi:hypothetical protein